MTDILEILNRKIELLNSISEDAKAQEKNIENSDLDAIEYIITRRERFMEEISEIDKNIAGKDFHNSDIKEKFDAINSLAREIAKKDRANMVAMENLIESNKEDLKQVKDGIKVNSAYFPPNEGSMMINRES